MLQRATAVSMPADLQCVTGGPSLGRLHLMSSNVLRSTIDNFAKTFASSIVAAIKGASLDEILTLTGAEAPAARRGPGRPRGAATAPKPASKPAVGTAAAKPAPARKPASAPAKKIAKGRLHRRSPADIAKALEQVVAVVKKNPKGLRAEQIRAELKMDAKEMPRVLKEGLGKKVLKSKGVKRSTTYMASA